MTNYPQDIIAAYAERKISRGENMALSKVLDIPKKLVIRQVKQVIDATGIKLQRINTDCFKIGERRNRRYIKTAEAGTCV